MTPMRKTFVTIERLLSGNRPERHLERFHALFGALMNFARDSEEAGAAAIFMATALIFLRDGPGATSIAKMKLKEEVSNAGQALAAVMLLRRGMVKMNEVTPLFPKPDAGTFSWGLEAGVLVFRSNHGENADAMRARTLGGTERQERRKNRK